MRYHKGEDNHRFTTLEERIKNIPWGGTRNIQILGQEETLVAGETLLNLTDIP